MGAVFLKLLQMSVTAGYMILAVVALRVVLKKAPKWIICLLWGFVGVRLACPVSVKSVFSLIPRGETAPRGMGAAPYGAFDAGSAVVNEAAVPALSSAAAPAAADAARTDVFITAVSAVWLTGVIVMLAYALISFMRLKRSVATAVPSKDGVMVCDEIASPFLLGLLRPAIYVPADLPEATLQNVMEHETAHFKRGDHVWKPLGYLLLAAHWFNPLCWLAYLLLCRDIEAACDEKVIRRKDKAGLAAYSQALLDCSFPRTGFSACPLAFGEVGVKQRIRSVLGYKKPAGWVLLTAAVLCALVVVSLMTDPVAAARSFSFQKGVTEIAVTRILGGKTEERRFDGEALRRWDAWLSGLRCEERAFAPGKTPGDVNGGERYVITASAPNGSVQYSYLKNGERDCWLLVDGAWYAVQKPADPPAAFGKTLPPAKQAADDAPLPFAGTAQPERSAAQTAQGPEAGAAAPSAGNGSASEQTMAAPDAAPREQPGAAQTANGGSAQAQENGRDDAATIPPPSYSYGGDDAGAASGDVDHNGESRDNEAAALSAPFAVGPDTGSVNVSMQAGDDLYTVYGYRDYIGSLRILPGAYQNDAVQKPADAPEDPYDGGEDPADEIEIPADGFEDYAGGIEVPPEDEPMTVAVD